MPLLTATHITSAAIVAMAVAMIVAAVFALRAFGKQSAQLALLKSGTAESAVANKPPPLQKLRWTAALLITGTALAFSAYWLATGTRLACQVTTVSHHGSLAATTKACGPPDVTDFVYVLAVVVVLILPDLKSLKIGGFELQRLTDTVHEQTREIDRLTNTVNTTINITAAAQSLTVEARTEFRRLRTALSDLRDYLPGGSDQKAQLAQLDEVGQRADEAQLGELLVACRNLEALIAQARKAKAAADLIQSGREGDTADADQRSKPAPAVTEDILGTEPRLEAGS
jgi:hypothetical protein